MGTYATRRTIVMADDDADDCALVRDAFGAANVDTHLEFVTDGRQLLAFLRATVSGGVADRGARRDPAVILLDLNMPHMDGREALAAIRADPSLCHLPVVVFSTSKHRSDILGSYQAGANSYIVKPASFSEFTRIARELGAYWLDTVAPPTDPVGKR
jgi:CheY-like chemotaxis protein